MPTPKKFQTDYVPVFGTSNGFTDKGRARRSGLLCSYYRDGKRIEEKVVDSTRA